MAEDYLSVSYEVLERIISVMKRNHADERGWAQLRSDTKSRLESRYYDGYYDAIQDVAILIGHYRATGYVHE